ncbi:MAG: hypothetical protein WAO76_03830 [Georgfuchsia sp.]
MPRYKVAHIREQGVDLIIIPLEGSFDHKIASEQQEIVGELQIRAQSAGLAGKVIPVWETDSGRMGFIAPQNWHPFFRSLSLNSVVGNLNKEIYW